MALSKIDIENMITGEVNVANGGTGLSSGTTNQFLKFTGSTTLASAADNAGKILQVQSMNYSTEVNRTSTSYGDTGVDDTITPSATSSKILVIASIGEISIGNNGTTGIDMKLWRSIGASDTDLITQLTNDVGAFTVSDIYRDLPHVSCTYLDSPNTTSECRYRVAFKGNNTSAYVGVQQHSSTSSITLMEIGA